MVEKDAILETTLLVVENSLLLLLGRTDTKAAWKTELQNGTERWENELCYAYQLLMDCLDYFALLDRGKVHLVEVVMKIGEYYCDIGTV